MHPAVLSSRLFHEKILSASASALWQTCYSPFGSKVVSPASLLATGGMPRVRTDPVPSCSGCDPAVERGHTTLPTEDAPIAHYRATQCAVCRMVVSLRSLTFHALLQPDGDLYLYLGVHIPAIPSLRHHLHHVSIGVVKPRVRVDLMPTLHNLEQLVAAHRQHITHVRFVPHGRGLHFEIPPTEPLAQLVQVLRAHLCVNGFLFSYQPVPHVTWL